MHFNFSYLGFSYNLTMTHHMFVKSWLLVSVLIAYARSTGSFPGLPATDFAGHWSYSTTQSILKSWQQAAPSLVTILPSIGQSYEKRDIPVVCIGHCSSPTDKLPIPAVLWLSMVHAREVCSQQRKPHARCPLSPLPNAPRLPFLPAAAHRSHTQPAHCASSAHSLHHTG